MKKYSLIIVFLLFITSTFAQHRADNWMLGYKYNNLRPGIDFTSGQPDTFSFTGSLNFFITAANICDTSGQLLFYTNGQLLFNANHDTLSNSLNFNPGFGTQYYYNSSAGYYIGHGIAQGAIIVPNPGNHNQYYVFYETFEPAFAYTLPNDTTHYNTFQPIHLSYSLVDMTLDNGLGGIDLNQKNIHAIDDTLLLGRITACKHANGRDWWLLVHKFYSDIYYKILITPYGISTPTQQNAGLFLYPGNGSVDYDVLGQSCFSPDGKQYAMMGGLDTLEVFGFDRCSGLLINHRIATVPDTNGFFARGISFSPNSRYLYISNLFKIYQYDTWASNLDSSRQLVAEWDSFAPGGIPAYFFMHQLAPNGKIYISTWNSSKYFEIIDSPDSAGAACNVIQHGLELSNYNHNLPNFPNYDLGPLTGSICDSLTVGISSIELNQPEVFTWPNPAANTFSITSSKKYFDSISVTDINGKIIFRENFPRLNDKLVNSSTWAPGVYIISINIPEDHPNIFKIVKL